jgi:outer membrane immunogenic protein
MKTISLPTIAFAALAATSAIAADIPAPVYKAPPVVVPVFSWTGCYIGATAGAVRSNADITWAPNPEGFAVGSSVVSALGNNTIHQTGFTGGGEIGCNYQTGSFVIGAEGDWQYTNVNSTLTSTFAGAGILAPATATETVQSRWLATARGRAGFAVDKWLFYVTGGAAFAEAKFSDNIAFAGSGTFNAASSNDTRVGWVVGGGVEWAFDPHWTVKAEYLHADLGTVSFTSANSNPAVFPLSTINHSHRLTEDIGRIGVNWRF